MDKRARLLIVDDDPMILESLISILEAEGYKTRAARTGQEALRELKRGFFNALLVDMKLPDMTGLELLTRVKNTTPRIRKLILTGFPDAASVVETVNQKADAYLIKPFDPYDLIRLIEKNLEEQQEELRLTHEKVLDYVKVRLRKIDEDTNVVH